MKKIKTTNKLLILVIFSTLTVLLSACSGDKSDKNPTEKTTVGSKSNKIHHADIGEASQTVKQKFADEFSKKCVARELKNSINKESDEKRLQQNCSCIANHIAEDLSDVDAEKYLQEHEDTQTLEIKFDTAAFFCLQNKPQPKGPHLFGKE